MNILTKNFWSYSLERAIKTFSQAGLAYLGGTAAGVFAVDWVGFLSVSLGAALLSVLTSVATPVKD